MAEKDVMVEIDEDDDDKTVSEEDLVVLEEPPEDNSSDKDEDDEPVKAEEGGRLAARVEQLDRLEIVLAHALGAHAAPVDDRRGHEKIVAVHAPGGVRGPRGWRRASARA